MPRNKISDLRNHLFETLEALKDPENPMALDRAKAISDVAQTIINSAKVEVDLVKAVSASSPGTTFFDLHEHDMSPGEPRLASGAPARPKAS